MEKPTPETTPMYNFFDVIEYLKFQGEKDFHEVMYSWEVSNDSIHWFSAGEAVEGEYGDAEKEFAEAFLKYGFPEEIMFYISW